jgi:hypothetical protein
LFQPPGYHGRWGADGGHEKSLVLRSTNDVQRNILAHQAVSSEPGSLDVPEHGATIFSGSWNAIGLSNHYQPVGRVIV